MDPVWLFLLSIAAIFLIGALGEVTFQRTNIPDVIWLILAGIVLGPIAGFVTREQLNAIAPYFAALTLVVVLFEGGSALKLGELSRAAPRSTALALAAFSLSVVVLAPASMAASFVGLLPDSWTWTHGIMLGTILGGSSSIIIMPAMAQARMKAKVANLVNLESALTDAFCVVGTVALIDIMRGDTADNPAVTLLKSFGIGLVVGGVAGLVWLLFLKLLRSQEHAYPVTLSALLILYVLIDNFGGSAALGILTVAVLLGNAPLLSKAIGLAEAVELDTSVRGFHRQMAFIIKSFFFVFIGAMLSPPWGEIALGLIFGGMLLAARVPAMFLATLASDFDRSERKMITVSMPRGMAAGVLATLPAAKGIVGTETLPVIVFSAVLTTILVFAVGFPMVRREMKAADNEPVDAVPLPAGAAVPAIRSVPPPPPSGEGAAAPQVSPAPEPAGPSVAEEQCSASAALPSGVAGGGVPPAQGEGGSSSGIAG